MSADQYEKDLHVQGDSYKQTVLALRAFANEILFDDRTRKPVAGGVVRCGRSMTTSPDNRHSPSTVVTPDLVIQPTAAVGVVAEAKWGFHRASDAYAKAVAETAQQLEKYDDSLIGWPAGVNGEGTILNHDLVLLVNHEDSKRVARELSARQNDGRLTIRRKLAVIGVGQFKRAEGIWTELDLEHGSLTDQKKTRKLNDRLPIKPEKLAQNPEIGLVELCDCEPPAPVMMELVQKGIVQNLTRDENEDYLIEGEVRKLVTLNDLMEWTRRFAFKAQDARDRDVNRRDWIARAMNNLVLLGWAENSEKDAWFYVHKKGRREPYKRFISFIAHQQIQAANRAAADRAKAERRETEQAERERANAANAAQVARDEVTDALEQNPLFVDWILASQQPKPADPEHPA